ncbi:MAG: hypothetical protein AAB415_02770 [Patescibacteria group bacterium]
MDQEIQQKLVEQDAKLEAIYRSVEKTRKYILIIVWVTVIGLVLPMIALAFVLPSFLSNYLDVLKDI